MTQGRAETQPGLALGIDHPAHADHRRRRRRIVDASAAGVGNPGAGAVEEHGALEGRDLRRRQQLAEPLQVDDAAEVEDDAAVAIADRNVDGHAGHAVGADEAVRDHGFASRRGLAEIGAVGEVVLAQRALDRERMRNVVVAARRQHEQCRKAGLATQAFENLVFFRVDRLGNAVERRIDRRQRRQVAEGRGLRSKAQQLQRLLDFGVDPRRQRVDEGLVVLGPALQRPFVQRTAQEKEQQRQRQQGRQQHQGNDVSPLSPHPPPLLAVSPAAIMPWRAGDSTLGYP